MTAPPYATMTDRFDSVVDIEHDPAVYAVFDNSFIYPEYIIRFRPVGSL